MTAPALTARFSSAVHASSVAMPSFCWTVSFFPRQQPTVATTVLLGIRQLSSSSSRSVEFCRNSSSSSDRRRGLVPRQQNVLSHSVSRNAQSCRFSTALPTSPAAPSKDGVKYDADNEEILTAAPMASTWKGVKRFYSRIDIAPATISTSSSSSSSLPTPTSTIIINNNKQTLTTQLWNVLIEGRVLRTNGMNELAVPSKSMAIAIAGEFASQGEFVVPVTTPIYNLASSAIDNYVLEDIRASEDLEAEMRATRLSTFDRILASEHIASAMSSTAASLLGAGNGTSVTTMHANSTTTTTTTASAALASLQSMEADTPTHAKTSLTGRADAGGMGNSSGSFGTSRLRDLALDHLETDGVCYRIDDDVADPGDRVLLKRQEKYYGPLLRWFHDAFGVQLGIAKGFQDLQHPDAAYEVAEDVIDIASPWVKAFYAQTLACTKSTVISFALAHRATDTEGAFTASRLEEEWQIGEHGFVEDGHDSQRAHLRLQLATAMAYLSMLPKTERVAGSLPSPKRAQYAAALAESIAARTARVSARRAREMKLVTRKREAMKRMALQEAEEEAAAKKAADQAIAAYAEKKKKQQAAKEKEDSSGVGAVVGVAAAGGKKL